MLAPSGDPASVAGPDVDVAAIAIEPGRPHTHIAEAAIAVATKRASLVKGMIS